MTREEAVKLLQVTRLMLMDGANQPISDLYYALGMAIEALEQIENSSEKPNNCEPQTIRCPKCGRTDYIRDMEKDMGIKGSHYKYKCINCNTYIKDEPTISKMEQVDWKDQMWTEAMRSCGFNVDGYRQGPPKNESQTETKTETQNSNLTFEKQTDCPWK